MNQGRNGFFNPLDIGRPVLMRETGDTAQITTLLTARDTKPLHSPLDTIKASATESHEIGMLIPDGNGRNCAKVSMKNGIATAIAMPMSAPIPLINIVSSRN